MYLTPGTYTSSKGPSQFAISDMILVDDSVYFLRFLCVCKLVSQ